MIPIVWRRKEKQIEFEKFYSSSFFWFYKRLFVSKLKGKKYEFKWSWDWNEGDLISGIVFFSFNHSSLSTKLCKQFDVELQISHWSCSATKRWSLERFSIGFAPVWCVRDNIYRNLCGLARRASLSGLKNIKHDSQQKRKNQFRREEDRDKRLNFENPYFPTNFNTKKRSFIRQ